VIGGVVGVALIGMIVFFLLRRRRSGYRSAAEPVDLLEGREGELTDDAHGDVPQHYLPEPYHIPPTAVTEMSETVSGLSPLTARDGRMSQLSLTTQTRLSSDETSTAPGRSTVTSSAKSPAGPPNLRAVNIIQHEDAGPSEAPRNEGAETIELPPAYTNIRK
jgi:cell division septation protein DedD